MIHFYNKIASLIVTRTYVCTSMFVGNAYNYIMYA